MDGEPTGFDSLRLRIPEPKARPGDKPVFRDLLIDRAGEVRRPPIDVKPADIVDLGAEMIRVLDIHGEAVGPWAGTLDAEQLRRGLRDMLTVRIFDARMLQSHRQGNTSFYMQSLGEEAVSCAHRRALRPDDMCFPTYRQQGLLIAADYPLVTMINQIYSNSHDPLKGRQLPVMYSSRDA
ncbi:MAG: 3-methyl-2-oxobutanoate dehydrogenase (2-methylpropanoyl-transferring) subunit alpha, partial [Ilumatobacteraceae bacterium]|nr:3-methyl-2-oxobutanoate dehydrogenase (2-methylpropanoyl-transferring) subunit alpha [Ilumatobacteraceae bacterium]